MPIPPQSGLPLRFGVIVLAAGASSRMGRPKLLLPWRGTTVLGHLLDQWAALGAAQTTVVFAPGDLGIQAELDLLSVPAVERLVNPEPARGMFSSVQCAARWCGWRADLTHWVVVLGDQPHLRPDTLRALLEHAVRFPGAAVQPARHGRPRHPVVLPAGVFRALAVSTAETLRHFLAHHSAASKPIELDDPGLDLDLDTPEDYEAALRLDGKQR